MINKLILTSTAQQSTAKQINNKWPANLKWFVNVYQHRDERGSPENWIQENGTHGYMPSLKEYSMILITSFYDTDQ